MKNWFISDLHLGHTNILKYEPESRPFDSIHEMNKYYTELWNDQVDDNDTIYHIGDFSWGDPRIYLEKLKGKIKLVRGNHDRQIKKAHMYPSLSGHKTEVLDLIQKVKIEDEILILCHYPMESWPHKFYGSIHLFGHVHSKKNNDSGLRNIPNRLHVGIDELKTHFYTLEDILLAIRG